MLHTPSIVKGAVFGFGKGPQRGALQCTRLDDGQVLWQQVSDDWRNDSQLTVADGLIFAVTRKNMLVLLEASREGYNECGRVDPKMTFGLAQQPMIANGRLYLRGEKEIVCYRITP
jgi:hypothetical protein